MKWFRPLVLNKHPILRWLVRFAVLASVLALLLYPWAVDAVLWHNLRKMGVSTESRETGYEGFTWNHLAFSRDGIVVSAGSVTVPSLISLAGLSKSSPVVIEKLSIDLSGDRPGATDQESISGMDQMLTKLFDILPTLEQFMPAIQIEQAEVILGAGDTVTGNRLEWHSGQISVEEASWKGNLPKQWNDRLIIPDMAYLTVGRRGKASLHFDAGLSRDVALSGSLEKSSDGPSARLQAGWTEGELEMKIAWASSGWLAERYQLDASGTGIPYLSYDQANAFEPHASIALEYNSPAGEFSLNLEGSGYYRDIDSKQKPIPWKVEVVVDGTPETVHVPEFSVDLPFLKARLENSFLLDRGTLLPEQAACFEWDMDLSSGVLPGFSGNAGGSLCLDPSDNGKQARFTVSGKASSLILPGGLWPEPIEQAIFSGSGIIDEASIQAEQMEIRVNELADASGELSLNWLPSGGGSIALEGRLLPGLLNRWIPREQVALSDDGIRFRVEASKGSAGWAHSGEVSAASALIRDSLRADLQLAWHGMGQNLDMWSVQIDRDNQQVTGTGSLRFMDNQLTVAVHRLAGRRASSPSWEVERPFELVYRTGDDETSPVFTWEPLQIGFARGGRLVLQGHWSGWDAIAVTGEVTSFQLSELNAWIEDSRMLSGVVSRLNFSISSRSTQSAGHAWTGSGQIEGNWRSPDGLLIAGVGGWFIEPNRIGFDELEISVDGTDWFAIDGVVPVSLYGDAQQPLRLQVHESDPLQINCTLEPVADVPRFIHERLPFELSDLQASLSASGTLTRPSASIKANAGSVSWQKPFEDTVYSVMDLVLEATIGVDSLSLERFSLRLPEAPTSETIQAEIREIDWVSLLKQPGSYPWNTLAGSARIDAWPVASLGSFLPGEFVPQGHFSLDMSKDPGEWPDGTFSFDGLMWRSLDAGIIAREIHGSALINGKRLEDLNMAASVGGGLVQIGGWIDFGRLQDPRFQVKLQSDRFDLVRRSNLILRGSADLEAVYLEDDPYPLLKGEIELIRSLWLSDLQDFTRQGVAGVSQRPPYFSLKTKPFDDWRLDLNIFGQKFLRLQSTLLTGTASTEFTLRGTLGDPLLVGNAVLSDGAIIFPFASLKTTGIEAWISEDEPHTIKLSGTGEGVVYGYLVQYHLSGTSELPAISFTSIPSLTQQDILLMLTTGAVPSAELTANINQRTQRIGFFIGRDIFSSLIGQSGASRLEFRSGDGFSPFRRESQLLEYRINDDWSIIGEYDDFGGYNVDVRRILLER